MTALREGAVIAFFVVASLAMTWPLARNFTRAVADPGDPFFAAWVLDWDYHATSSPARLFDANIFHPERLALAFSDHSFGIAIWFFPLLALGVAPLTVHNIALVAAFAGSGYAMYLLARFVTGSAGAALAGGVAFAFVGFRFHHLPHVQYVWSVFLPLILLALLAFFLAPSIRTAFFMTAALVANGASNAHWFVFGTAAFGITAIVLAVTTGRWRERRVWFLFAGSLALAVVVLPAPAALSRAPANAPRGTADR